MVAVCTTFQPSQTDALAPHGVEALPICDANFRKAATKADELVRSKYIKVYSYIK
jgi:hypothetical protein